MSNVEIEDVLSSIRRLVASESADANKRLRAKAPENEALSAQQAKSAAQEVKPAEAPSNRLVLTSAQRVDEREARDAKAVGLATLEATIAELEAAVADSDEAFELDGGDISDNDAQIDAFAAAHVATEDDASEVAEADEFSASANKMRDGADDAEEIFDAEPEFRHEGVVIDLAVPMRSRMVEDEEKAAPAKTEPEKKMAAKPVAENHPETSAATTSEANSDDLWVPAGAEAHEEIVAILDAVAPEEPWTRIEDIEEDGASEAPNSKSKLSSVTIGKSKDESVAPSSDSDGLYVEVDDDVFAGSDAALAAFVAELGDDMSVADMGSFSEDEIDSFGVEDPSALNEETLRLLVGEIVREELRGALGERITRNVRKLVRREMMRGLAKDDQLD